MLSFEDDNSGVTRMSWEQHHGRGRNTNIPCGESHREECEEEFFLRLTGCLLCVWECESFAGYK